MNDAKARFYDQIADELDDLASDYDLRRRLEVLFDELLDRDLAGARLLDAGCGTGHAGARAARGAADVVAMDIGLRLVDRTRARASIPVVNADALALPFADRSFDIVISSEMIEHTPTPARAVAELARVLRVDGILLLSCPNRLWQLPVRLASRCGLRPFHGHENFPSPSRLARMAAAAGLKVERHIGLHPWPFQIRPLQRLSSLVDRQFGAGFFRRLMINQAIRARRIR